MKKNGFVFIETIVTTVILSASLLLLYSSYSSSIQNERSRINYEDVSYLYKTNYIRKFLEENTNIDAVKRYAFIDSYIVTIGPSLDTMFTVEQANRGLKKSLERIYNIYNINRILLVKKEFISECFEYEGICNISNENLSYGLASYIKSLNDISYDYYLVAEYTEKIDESGDAVRCIPGKNDECNSYFVNIGM